MRDVCGRVCSGVISSIPNSVTSEVWHEYISVSQLQKGLQSQIILAIPDIYHRATFVMAYLSDLDASDVGVMRTEQSMYKRCRAICNIYNAKYFSRMWTAMELTQSSHLRVMLKDFTVIKEITRSSIGDIFAAWCKEVGKTGSSSDPKRCVGMGHSLVPL